MTNIALRTVGLGFLGTAIVLAVFNFVTTGGARGGVWLLAVTCTVTATVVFLVDLELRRRQR